MLGTRLVDAQLAADLDTPTSALVRQLGAQTLVVERLPRDVVTAVQRDLLIYLLQKLLVGAPIFEAFVVRVKDLRTGKKAYYLISRVLESHEPLESFQDQGESLRSERGTTLCFESYIQHILGNILTFPIENQIAKYLVDAGGVIRRLYRDVKSDERFATDRLNFSGLKNPLFFFLRKWSAQNLDKETIRPMIQVNILDKLIKVLQVIASSDVHDFRVGTKEKKINSFTLSQFQIQGVLNIVINMNRIIIWLEVRC